MTRLFILGALARGGPMHGHQIRRNAQTDRTELWTDIRVGSLYGALKRMAAEGVIEAVRTEQAGNRPERTVYAITEAGRQEFFALRDEALHAVGIPPDPVELALVNTDTMEPDRLRGAVESRLRVYAAKLVQWRNLREHADPYLTPMERLIMEHGRIRLEAEIAWHEQLLTSLPGGTA